MTAIQAHILVDQEFSSDTGLDMLFRMSQDVEEARIQQFIAALQSLAKHYKTEQMIERKLAYQLYSIENTLKASMGHWKVSRPKGLDSKTCFKIFSAISDIFGG